jgi:hypothetical protein
MATESDHLRKASAQIEGLYDKREQRWCAAPPH